MIKQTTRKGAHAMHPLFKKIVKKNSILAGTGLVLVLSGVACIVAACAKTVTQVRGTMTKALDEYAEKENRK